MSEEIEEKGKTVKKKSASKKVAEEKRIRFDTYFVLCKKPASWKAGMKHYKGNCAKMCKTKAEWDDHFADY